MNGSNGKQVSKRSAVATTSQPPEQEGIPIALRERVLALIESEGALTQERVATEAGMSPSTLNLFLRDRYPADPTNVEAKLERWITSREERAEVEALAPEPPAFFESRTSSEIMDAFRYAQTLDDMIAVMGVPGIGKSVTIREYQRRYPNVWVATLAAHTTGVVPVLREIVDAVRGAPAAGASALAREIGSKLTGTRGLLVIDEAHHASTSALDAVRAIYDATGVAVALVGGLELAVRLERMPQLYSRLGIRLFRQRALRQDVDALLDAWAIDSAAARKHMVAEATKPGALRELTQTLRLATLIAHGAGEELELRHLKTAGRTLSARVTRASDHV